MRKAQSEVITTVLIILLVLAAVFIVYTAVRSMVTTGTGTAEEKAKCIGLELSVVSATATTQKVGIQRGAGGDEDEVTAIILINGKINDTCTNNKLSPLESADCTLAIGVLVAGDNVTVGGKYGEVTCETLSEKFTVTT